MNPVDLLVAIIREHAPKDIWQDSPLIRYRMLGNTNRGEIGEEFIRRFLDQHEIRVGNGGRTSRTDLRIGNLRIESKDCFTGRKRDLSIQPRPLRSTVRLPTLFRYMPAPSCIQHVAQRCGCGKQSRDTGANGVRDKQVTYKLTKKLDEFVMQNIADLPSSILETIDEK